MLDFSKKIIKVIIFFLFKLHITFLQCYGEIFDMRYP